jgi:hypothetical protein
VRDEGCKANLIRHDGELLALDDERRRIEHEDMRGEEQRAQVLD